jgi:hypothetical protein
MQPDGLCRTVGNTDSTTYAAVAVDLADVSKLSHGLHLAPVDTGLTSITQICIHFGIVCAATQLSRVGVFLHRH